MRRAGHAADEICSWIYKPGFLCAQTGPKLIIGQQVVREQRCIGTPDSANQQLQADHFVRVFLLLI